MSAIWDKGHTSDDISALTPSLLSKLFTASFVEINFPAPDRKGKVWLEKGRSNTKASSLGSFCYAPVTLLMDIWACILPFKMDK